LDTRRLTIEQAHQLLDEYQSEFGLLDWTVRLDILRRAAIPKRNASVAVTEAKKEACISLLHADDYPATSMTPQDMEVDLAHETLHVALAPFLRCRRGSHKDIVQEQAVHAFSTAYVFLKREVRTLRAENQRLRSRRKKAA
jgi:hypothetical protein